MCVSFTCTRHDRKSFGWGIPIKEELFMSYQLWIIGFQPWPRDLCDQGDFWLLEEIGKIKIKNDWFALHLVFLPGLLFHSNSPDSQTCHLRTSVKGWQPKVKNNTPVFIHQQCPAPKEQPVNHNTQLEKTFLIRSWWNIYSEPVSCNTDIHHSP